MKAQTVIGVDVGGTFTDLVLFDGATGRVTTAKMPSQRGNEAEGFLTGLGALGRIAEFGAIVHGTTVGTNALLERKGAQVGLITTPGFRDVLEMRRRDRPRTWGLRGDFIPDRRARFRGRGRRAHPGRRVDPRRGRCRGGRARARGSSRRKARRRWRSCSSTPTPIPPTSATPRRRRAPCGRTSMWWPHTRSCPKSASSSALRRPRSTPICSRSSAIISIVCKARSRNGTSSATSISCSRTAA